MKRSYVWLIPLILFLFVSACAGASSGTAQTWIDAPRLNSQYVVGETINIVLHATDQGSGQVEAIAVFINGELQATLPNQSGDDLATFNYSYTPQAAGDYLLEAAAQDSRGQWSATSMTTFDVVESARAVTLDLPDAPADAPPTEAPSAATNIPPTPEPSRVTSIPPTSVPPTSVPPTPTTPPDTEQPVILQLTWDPLSPLEDQPVSFSIVAQDNVAVTRIEIYFVREGESTGAPIHVCNNTTVCEYQASSGFLWGNYSYFAIAYDAAGNQVSSFNQAVLVQQVVK